MIRSLKPLVAIILLAVVQGTDILIIFFRFTHCYFVCSFCWLDFYDFRRTKIEEASKKKKLASRASGSAFSS